MAFDAGTVGARLTLDRDPFQRSLRAAQGEARTFARKVFSARLAADEKPAETATERAHRIGERYGRSRFEASYGVDLSRVVSGYSAARKQAEAWAAENPEAAAGLDISEVAAKMATARQLVRTFGQTTATKTVEVKVVDEIDRAKRRIESLEKVVENASDEEVRIEAEANVRAARIRLDQLKQLARSVGLTDADIEAEVRVSGMDRFRAAVGDIKGALNSTRDRFDTTMYTMRNVADASMRAAALGIVGSLGPGSSAVIAAGAGLSSIGAGFGLLALAANETFRKVEVENGSLVAKTGETLDKSQKELVEGLNGFAKTYAREMAPASNVMDRIIGKAAKLGEESMPFIGTVAERTATRVENAFDKVVEDAREPGQLKTFRRFLSRVPGMTGKATEAIGSVGIGAINVLERAQPHFDRWLSRGQRLANRFREWTQSPEGKNSIDKFLKDNLPVVEDFAAAAGEIALGIGKLGTSEGARDLFRELAEVLGTAGDNLPKLEPALGLMSRVIGKFNDLPPSLQNLALQGAAYGFVFNALGGGFLVGIVGAVTKLLLVKGLFSRVKAIGDLSRYLRDMGRTGPVGQGPGGAIPATQKPGKARPVTIPTRYAPPKGKVPAPRGGFPPIVMPSRYGTPKGKVPKPAGGFPPIVVPVGLPTGGGASKGFGSKLGQFLKKVPVVGSAIALGARIVGPIGNSIKGMRISQWIAAAARKVGFGTAGRLIGGGLLRAVGAVLFGPVGIGLLIADLFSGGAVTKGITQAVKDFKAGWMRAWNEGKDKSLARRIADAILTGLATSFRFGKIVAGFKNGWMRAWNEGKDKSLGRRIADGIFTGLASALKEAPLVGPFVKWMDRGIGGLLKWLGIKSPSTRAKNRIGKPIAEGVLAGLKEVPLVGGLVRLLDNMFGRAKATSGKKRWGGIGSGAASAIANGWRRGGLIGAAVSLVASWFGKAQGEKNKKKWSPVGGSAAGLIAKGWKNGGLIGAAAALIASWFSKSQSGAKGKKWQPIGGGAAGAIAKGWKNGGLIGAATALVSSWFGKSQGSSKQKKWGGIGGSAAGAIAKGWKNGGLLGAAVSLIGSFFQSSKKTRDKQGWYGIGKAAVDGIIRGVRAQSPVLNAVITAIGRLLPDWAKKALGISSPSKPFTAIGENLGESWAGGMEKKIGRIRGAAERMAREAAAAAQGAYSPELSASVSRAGTRNLPALARERRAHRTNNYSHSVGGVTVNVYASAGRSAGDVGAEVERRLRLLLRELEGQAGTSTMGHGGAV